MNYFILGGFLLLTFPLLIWYTWLLTREWQTIKGAADGRSLPEAPGPWLRMLSGAFVSLGLLFTFIGISFSIRELSIAFKDGSVATLNEVMAPLGAKFITSIIGLLAYILTSGGNTFLAKLRSDRLREFQQEEDAALDQAHQAEVNQATAQVQTMVQHQRELLQAIVGLQDTFRFDAQNPGPVQNMAIELSRRLSEDLGMKLGEILTNTDAFAQIQAQTRELMRSIQGTTASLDEATRGMSEQAPRLIQQMNDASVQMNEAITQASCNLENAACSAAAGIGSSMVDFSTATREAIQALGGTLNTQIEASVSAAIGRELAQTIQHQFQVGQEFQASLSLQVDRSTGRLATTIESLQIGLDSTMTGLSGCIADLEGQVSTFGKELGVQVTKGTEGMNLGIEQGIQHLGTSLTLLMEEMDRQTRDHTESLQGSATAIKEQAEQVMAGIGENRQNQIEVKKDMANLTRTAATLVDTSQDLRTAFETNQVHLERQAEAIRTVQTEVTELGCIAKAQTQHLGEVRQEIEKVAKLQVDGLEHIGNGLQGLHDQAQEHAQQAEDLRRGLEQTLQQVEQLAGSTEKLTAEVSAIQRLTSALSLRVEQVFQALSSLATKLTGGLFGRKEPAPVAENESAGLK